MGIKLTEMGHMQPDRLITDMGPT